MPLYNPSSSSAGAANSGYPALLAPFLPAAIGGVGTNTSNFIFGCRCVAGITGTLHDLTVYIGTASGNLRVGVYDTGDLSAGNRSLLYGSGSVAAAGAGAYQVVADPNIAVTAGKAYDLVVFTDNNLVSIGRQTSVAAGASTLPTSFLPVTGGASPKLMWGFNLAYAALPATITEAQCAANGTTYWVGGRIS